MASQTPAAVEPCLLSKTTMKSQLSLLHPTSSTMSSRDRKASQTGLSNVKSLASLRENEEIPTGDAEEKISRTSASVSKRSSGKVSQTSHADRLSPADGPNEVQEKLSSRPTSARSKTPA